MQSKTRLVSGVILLLVIIIGVGTVYSYADDTRETIDSLTLSEKEYLEQKQFISVAAYANREPFEKLTKTGEYKGMVAEFNKFISNKLELALEIVPVTSWNQATRKVNSGAADFVISVGRLDKQKETLELSQPFIKYPLVIATKQQELYINDLNSVSDRKIALSNNCPFYDQIREKYPELEFVKVDSVEQGLNLVQDNKVFGLINIAPVIGDVIQQQRMYDIKISGELSEQIAFRIGVNKENKLLLNIMKKVLTTVDKQEKEEILNSWMKIRYEKKFDYSLFIKVLIGIIIILLLMLYRHYKLTKFNQKLSSLTQQLTVANKKLANMSFVDGLTQIPNRRKFDEFLEREWKHCKREEKKLSLIMLDIDFFKEYNDLYGHLAGDDCLKEIAKKIEDNANRPRDLAARYGGEEFIIILPETDQQGAKQVATKLQNEINDLEIEHEASQIDNYITVSLGVVTTVPNSEKTIAEFVDAVDKLMYQAKDAGRNQIMSKKLS